MPRSRATGILVKIAIVMAGLAGFMYLFLRSAGSVRSEPYVIERKYTEPWTLDMNASGGSRAPVLVARPPAEFGDRLFDQIFIRMMESLRGTAGAGVPIVLRAEYDLALAGRYTPQSLLDAARTAGLESAAFTPVCVGVHRTSQPGRTQQVYFAIFESRAFIAFREQIKRGLDGQAGARFDPSALSPVLILGATEGDTEPALPIVPTAARDCVAPIAVK